MKYEGEERTLVFSSLEEVERFHTELSTLIRGAMVGATRSIEDAALAKDASREVLQQFHTLMSTLNVLRTSLTRKAF